MMFVFISICIILYIIKCVVDDIKITKNLTIDLKLFKIHFLKTKESVKPVLGTITSSLSHLNDNFNASHGMNHTINNYNSSDEDWKYLHQALKNTILTIIEKNDFDDIINNAFKEFMIQKDGSNIDKFVTSFWCQIMFGKVCDDEFTYFHDELMDILNYTFYENPYAKVPILGYVTSFFRYCLVAKRMKSLKRDLHAMMTTVDENSFCHIFETLIGDSKINFKYHVINDNIMMSFLLYDFILGLIKGLIIELCNETSENISKLCDDIETMNPTSHPYIKKIINDNFLFPTRCRIYKGIPVNADGILISKGDICFIDLLTSGYQFSYGPRRCVGFPLVNLLIKKILNLCKMYYIIRLDNELIKRKSDDIGMIVSEHSIHLISIDEFQNNLFIRLKNNIPILDISYYHYMPVIIKYFANDIQKIASENNIECLVSIEARGYSLAGSAQYITELPLMMVRKQGKLNNQCIHTSKGYKVGNDDNERYLEIANDAKYRKHSRVMIIDDGVASGHTLKTCINMLDDIDYDVVCVYVMHQHSYCEMVNLPERIQLYSGNKRI